jgi:hypothetical protein
MRGLRKFEQAYYADFGRTAHFRAFSIFEAGRFPRQPATVDGVQYNRRTKSAKCRPVMLVN